MLRNCQGSQRQRLLAKFTENDLEKVDRLLELHFKYMDKVDRTEKEMEVNPLFLVLTNFNISLCVSVFLTLNFQF